MSDDTDFGEYFQIIKKHWIWAIVCFIIVLGAVAAYTFLTEPVYESKSLIVITSQDQANFLLGNSAPKTADLETQKIIIQSPSIMNPIYEKYNKNSFDLTVSNIKNSNVIEITVQSNNPESSMVIANEIATSYINYTTEIRKADAEMSIDFINEKIEAYNDEINALDIQKVYYKNNTKLTRLEQLEYQAIEREITAKGKIYDYLLSKREEALLASNLNSANLKVISYADVPLLPVKPNKELNLALGIILALGAAVGAAMVADSMGSDSRKNKRY